VAPPPHIRDTEGRRRLLEYAREGIAGGDKTKVRPALVLLWASHHLDNLWRLESHLGRAAAESGSQWAATAPGRENPAAAPMLYAVTGMTNRRESLR